MRFRLKIRSKTANVAEVNKEKVKGGVKTFGVIIFGPLPRRGLRGWIWSSHFFYFEF
ncbi:hypothetical protein E2C01_001353 [Portunus trituberculatus]|uniref:Uncharacterized protein n=1 Tax=Portunus trituberculatus TaxID=210409 RepID=A0A5B7CHS4_PORTR|nr:hypothetical protein [Portunus trituberculatus]